MTRSQIVLSLLGIFLGAFFGAYLFGDQPRGYVPKPPPTIAVAALTEANLPTQMINMKADLGHGKTLLFDRVHKNLKLTILEKKTTSSTITLKVGMTGTLC